MGIENPIHLLFIAIVALLVLGPKRLPELARALGHGFREFREAVGMQGEPHVQRAELAPPPAEALQPLAAEAVQPVAAEAVQPLAAAPAAAEAVGPTQTVPSGDAPDRGPL